MQNGYFWNAGYEGYNWSGLASTYVWEDPGTGAYFMRLGNNERVMTSGRAERSNSLPLRYLAAAFSCLRFSKNVSDFLPRNRGRLAYTFSKT